MTLERQLVRTLARDVRRRWTVSGTLIRPSEPTFDPNTGAYTEGSTDVYSGQVGLRPQDNDLRQVEYGGQAVSLRTYEMEFPANTDARVDDRFTVSTAPFDDQLEGRTLDIIDVTYDERQVVRRVVAQDNITGGT